MLKLIDALGLTLWRLQSKCLCSELRMVFEVVLMSISKCLIFGQRALWKAAKGKSGEDFEARWPAKSEIVASSELLMGNRGFREHAERSLRSGR